MAMQAQPANGLYQREIEWSQVSHPTNFCEKSAEFFELPDLPKLIRALCLHQAYLHLCKQGLLKTSGWSI